jgi:hypothetical protein
MGEGAKNIMPTHKRLKRTELFLVRLWPQTSTSGSGEVSWCGRVQKTVDGQGHSFEGWPNLIDLLVSMMILEESDEE